jgi:hypothetical protein
MNSNHQPGLDTGRLFAVPESAGRRQ